MPTLEEQILSRLNDAKDAIVSNIQSKGITASGRTHKAYRDWETDRKSTRLNSSHSAKSRMPSSA